MSYVKVCKQCAKTPKDDIHNGYYEFISDDVYVCPICKNELLDTVVTTDEYLIIIKILNENSFIQAMIELKEKDPIEFQLKMSQFRTQLELKKQVEQKSNITINVPHCPICDSTNIKKISTISKAGSVAIWGIFSRKVHKQWHCNNCGSEW